jgi:proteic killer suppression protein
MIKSFTHKGLKLFFLTGKGSGIVHAHAEKLRHILIRLEICTNPKQLDLPGLRFHKLKGREKDFYSLTISGNWRIVFKFDGFNVTDVDYLDYH